MGYWHINMVNFVLLQDLGIPTTTNLPMILKVQITLVVGIITFITLVTYGLDLQMTTISNVWFWGLYHCNCVVTTSSSLINQYGNQQRD